MSRTPLDTFRNMKSRCYKENDNHYASYGGKGIDIYDKWLKNPVSFATWAENNGFFPGAHIHRIDNTRGYYPDNCEFLSDSEHHWRHCSQNVNINEMPQNAYSGKSCKCLRCGWTWEPRTEHPKYCPGCKSPQWRTVSRYGQKKDEKKERGK